MVAVTAAAVALFAVPLALAAGRLFRSREVSRLEREATRAAGTLPAAGLHGADVIKLPPATPRLVLAVYDSRGHRVAGTGPAAGGTEVRAALRGRVTDDHDGRWLAAAVPIHDEEAVVGAARAAVPWNVVAGRAHASWAAMAGLGALAVALAGGLAWWQAVRLTGPLEGLVGFAVRLGQGDFGARMDGGGVPEIDQAGEALNRTARRLGDLVARERAFTADVSHQLNTPLTSLRLGLESALLTPNTDPGDALETAVAEVERLERTVATLLALARDAPDREESCDAATVCRAVADRSRGALAAAGRPLRVDAPRSLPVRCPAEALSEILQVLLDNALAHGRGEVAIRARAAGTGVVVQVEDDGDGVADPGAAFERRSRSSSGHGIGLALARTIAVAHGARLELTRARPRPVFAVALAGVPRSRAN
jgi:signal transduction histidine kinase